MDEVPLRADVRVFRVAVRVAQAVRFASSGAGRAADPVPVRFSFQLRVMLTRYHSGMGPCEFCGVLRRVCSHLSRMVERKGLPMHPEKAHTGFEQPC